MRAGLRMNVIRTHGVEPLDFELWCLAVSAINGCGACVDSHEKVLREKGFGEEKVLAAVRVASVLHAIATCTRHRTGCCRRAGERVVASVWPGLEEHVFIMRRAGIAHMTRLQPRADCLLSEP